MIEDAPLCELMHGLVVALLTTILYVLAKLRE